MIPPVTLEHSVVRLEPLTRDHASHLAKAAADGENVQRGLQEGVLAHDCEGDARKDRFATEWLVVGPPSGRRLPVIGNLRNFHTSAVCSCSMRTIKGRQFGKVGFMHAESESTSSSLPLGIVVRDTWRLHP
jgi:hypothetical protein